MSGPVLAAVNGDQSQVTESIKVNVDNFVRAETAFQFDRLLQGFAQGRIGLFLS